MDILSRHKVLNIFVLISTGLGVLNEFVTNSGIPPFWQDVGISVLLIYSMIHWSTETLRGFRTRPTRIGFSRSNAGKVSSMSPAEVATYLAVLVILLAVLIWTAKSPASHLFNPKWRLCGVIEVPCHPYSLRLLDHRERTVLKSVTILDDTGYVDEKAPNRWTYRPCFVVAECTDRISSSAKLHDRMFDSDDCDGRLSIP